VPDRLYDLRYLKYASAAADLGSFRRAAQELGVCQSEVSRRIRAFEDRLGIDLFTRHRTGSKVTPAGRLFLEEAGRGLSLLSQATANVAAIRRAERGELRVGIIASLSAGALRRLLSRYNDLYPGVRVSLHRGTHEDHLARILNGAIDVAFVAGRPGNAEIASLSLWTEMKLVALPESHPLCQLETVSWPQLKSERFLVSHNGAGPEIQRHIIKHVALPGFSPHIVVHELGIEDILHLVAMGYGIALTSESVADAHIPGVIMRPLRDDVPLSWSAVWLNTNSNPSLRELLALARMASRQRQPSTSRTGRPGDLVAG
jgi:DNA-binding transcriptional LysR family regulator